MPQRKPYEHGVHHKEAPPLETINHISKILASVGISLSEIKFDGGADHCESLRVSPDVFAGAIPCPGTNGKGLNQELARASAYAEFMERLQNLSNQTPCLIKPSFGLMPEQLGDPPDAKSFTVNQLTAKNESSVNNLLERAGMEGASGKGIELVCCPFYHVGKNELVDIPVKLLFRFCSTNGMCAGNTPEEAMVQGICEIFERFVLGQMYRNRMVVPTIPHSILSGLRSFTLIEKLKESGYKVIVKDCTLGGRFPVVAVILYDPKNDRYLIRFGSDPSLDIALQRSITELFQGAMAKTFRENLLPLIWFQEARQSLRQFPVKDLPHNSLYRIFVDGRGPFVSSIFLSEGTPQIDKVFPGELLDNKQLLCALTGILSKEGYELLVRDVAYLGFPAFNIYVPGMSEIFDRSENVLTERLNKVDVWPFLLRLPEKTTDEIKQWAEKAEQLFDSKPSAMYSQPDLFNIMVEEECEITQLFSMEFLLSELFCRVGDYARGLKWLERDLDRAKEEEGYEIGNKAYTSCTMACLYLKSKNALEEEIITSLKEVYGEELTREVLSDINGPDKRFQNYTLPLCGECSNCEIRKRCYYDAWKCLVEKLKEKRAQNQIDQLSLVRCFQRNHTD